MMKDITDILDDGHNTQQVWEKLVDLLPGEDFLVNRFDTENPENFASVYISFLDSRTDQNRKFIGKIQDKFRNLASAKLKKDTKVSTLFHTVF